MSVRISLAIIAVSLTFWTATAFTENAYIDGQVIQVRLPSQDVTLFYVERKGGFTVKLDAKSGWVEAQKLYVGDEEIAVEMLAHPSKGITLQGVEMKQGDQFQRGSTIQVRPGYKLAKDLKPGDLYVILPSVNFEVGK